MAVPQLTMDELALVVGKMDLYYVRLVACINTTWKAASRFVEHSAEWQIDHCRFFELMMIQPRPPKAHMVRWFEAQLGNVWQPGNAITHKQWDDIDEVHLATSQLLLLHLAFSDVPAIREVLNNARDQVELWTDPVGSVTNRVNSDFDSWKEDVSWPDELEEVREAAMERATWHSAVTPGLPTMKYIRPLRVALCRLERNPDASWLTEENFEPRENTTFYEQHSEDGATVVLDGDPIGHVFVRDVHELRWDRVLGDALLIHLDDTDELLVLRCTYAWCGDFPWTHRT